MREGLRIGRLFGIDLIIDWSWAFVFILMTWNLTAVFGHWHPGWGPPTRFLLALVAALLFFASILAHELAHALVASSLGMTVTSIRLFLFGGVSNIEREPPSPRAEFLMAVIGPVVSLGLGIDFLILGWWLLPSFDPQAPWEAASQLGPVSTLLVWLGPVNIMLGLFNLVPGFPLDGGRILRAVLWRATKDLHAATRWASSVGRAIGWTFVLFGIAMFFGVRVPFFGGGAASGLWLAFIGWFLSSAAERSYESLRIQDALEGVTVAQLMRRSGPVVTATSSISALVEEGFLRSGDHAFPVVDGQRLVGLVCTGDTRKVARDAWPTTPISVVMTPVERLTLAAPNEAMASALRKLAQLDVEQLPVTMDGILAGMLERRQVARWLELRLGPPPRLVQRHAS
jgi:Zn-dependent protease/CBS domain-containing protein